MILTEHLTKRYGGLVAVNDLNLNIHRRSNSPSRVSWSQRRGENATTKSKLLARFVTTRLPDARFISGYDGIQKSPRGSP